MSIEYTRAELLELLEHLDDETDWQTVDEFWESWSPRCNDRIRSLIAMAMAIANDEQAAPVSP